MPGACRISTPGCEASRRRGPGVGDQISHTVAEGDGPVNALDAALRLALEPRVPELAAISLVNFKVRILDETKGTGAVTRVRMDRADGDRLWTTIGVSENIIEASWQALYDSLVFGLLHTSVGSDAG